MTALPPRLRGRAAAFAALVLVCAVVAIGTLLRARARSGAGSDGLAAPALAPEAALRLLVARPHLLFRSTAPGPGYGRVAAVPLGDPAAARAFTGLACERVAFSGGRGLCLTAERGVATRYAALVFDAGFRVTGRIELPGLPSRARVAPDGRLGAVTVFVSGDSYAPGTFSTRTTLVDLQAVETLADLESFRVSRDGAPVDAVDRNFWGVTFARESDRFYATLSTGGRLALVEGSVSQRSARVLRDDVECPSLSPDGTRVAFKRRTGGLFAPLAWRLHVLDLRTGRALALAETRSVDDQVEWLGDAALLYGLPDESGGSARSSVWRVPADGTGAPALLVSGAWSPSSVQPAAGG